MNSFQENVLPYLCRKLKESGNISGNFKLSLTTSSVCNLNDFLDGVLHDEHFTPSGQTKFDGQETQEDASVLNSAMTKIIALKVIHGLQTLQGQLDLSRFTSLKFLELKRVPAHLVKGLKELLPHLEVLLCNRSISFLKELFGNFADGEEIYCPNLRYLDLVYNYIEELDDTLRSLPNLQYLDMSHNALKHTGGIQGLNTIVVVNLNYNELDHVPPFTQEGISSLKILLMRNNVLEKLDGLERLINLEELDISYNCLSEISVLSSLEPLSFLKKVSLKNNPLSFHSKHRLLVTQLLHPNVVNSGFHLNGKPLTNVEIEAVSSGRLKSSHDALSTAVKIQISPINVVSDDLHPHEISSVSSFNSGATDSEKNLRLKASKKSFKNVREVEILDTSDHPVEKMDDKYDYGFRRMQLEGHYGDHSKEPMTDPSDTLQNPCPAVNLTTVSKEQKHDEICEESSALSVHLDVEKNNFCGNDGTTFEEGHHSSLIETENLEVRASSTCVFEGRFSDHKFQVQDSTAYLIKDMDDFAAVSARRSVNSISSCSSSEETEWNNTSADSDIDGDESRLFVVERKEKEETVTVFLNIGTRYLTEKDGLTGQHLDSLDLRMLQSVKRVDIDQPNSPCYEIHVTFDAIKKSRRKREYIVDDIEIVAEIVTLLESFIQQNVKSTTVSKLQCLKCSSEFLKEAAHHKVVSILKQEETSSRNWTPSKGHVKEVEEIDACPYCGSTTLIDASDSNYPDTSEPVRAQAVVDTLSESSVSSSGLLSGFISRVKSSPIFARSPIQPSALSTSGSFKNSMDDIQSENELNVRLPSYKSALSVDSARTDEIKGKKQSPLHPSLKCPINDESYNEKEDFGDAMQNKDLRRKHLMDDTSLTEFSQKNTDLLQEDNNNFNSAQNIFVNEDEANFSLCLDHGDDNLSLQDLFKEREIINKKTLTEIDHRLKLYLEVKLLQYDEHLNAVLKTNIILPTSGRFDGILVMSSKIMYFIKTDSMYGWEQVEKCLHFIDSKPLENLKAIHYLLGKQGFSLVWESENITVSTCIVKDADYCNAFISLLEDAVKERLQEHNIPIYDTMPEDKLGMIIRSSLQNECDDTFATSDTNEILLYILMNWADSEKGHETLNPVAVVVTTSSLFIISVEYLNSLSQCESSLYQPEINYMLMTKQKITSLTYVHLSEGCKTAGLHFLENENEADHYWLVQAETKSSLFSLISTIKDPWEKSFGIDFPVGFNQNCKCVQS